MILLKQFKHLKTFKDGTFAKQPSKKSKQAVLPAMPDFQCESNVKNSKKVPGQKEALLQRTFCRFFFISRKRNEKLIYIYLVVYYYEYFQHNLQRSVNSYKSQMMLQIANLATLNIHVNLSHLGCLYLRLFALKVSDYLFKLIFVI